MATLGVRGTGGAQGPTRGDNVNVSQREDLANFITMITRDETPFMSSIGSAKATAIYHEWQTDKLEVPGDSRIGEGTDYIQPTTNGGGGIGTDGVFFNKVGPNRTRLGNYTQINGKSIAVSGTRRAVDQAGVADEYAYQLKKRGTELRRDVEFDMIHSFNVAGAITAGGVASTARKAGGFQSFINQDVTTNYVGGWAAPALANQGNGTAVIRSASAAGVTAPATGSLSLSEIDSTMEKIYSEGGKASKIMVSPKLRRDFSDLMVSDTGVVRNIDANGKLRQSVDVYMSDFGDLMVVPNYIMGLPNTVQFVNGNGVDLTAETSVANFSALIYDPQWFAMANLRPLKEVDVGQKGDSTVGMMVEEATLEVRNPSGCGAIYGLA